MHKNKSLLTCSIIIIQNNVIQTIKAWFLNHFVMESIHNIDGRDITKVKTVDT